MKNEAKSKLLFYDSGKKKVLSILGPSILLSWSSKPYHGCAPE
jgi:hypothetical protein